MITLSAAGSHAGSFDHTEATFGNPLRTDGRVSLEHPSPKERVPADKGTLNDEIIDKYDCKICEECIALSTSTRNEHI